VTDADAVDHVLLTLERGERGERGELRIMRSRFEGRVFTKLQLFYPAKNGDLRPGRQVITIRDHELAQVVEALGRVARKVGGQPAPRRQRDARPRSGADRSRPVEREELADEELEADSSLF
jgi:hypothetical protein